MTAFVTSDTHIGHVNILKYCPISRPFNNVPEMNAHILAKWNHYVRPQDTVYHLGDVFMSDREAGKYFLSHANGKKYLVRGNHDKYKNFPYEDYFEWIIDYKEIKHDKTKIVLCHFPIEHWNLCGNGSIHLHGHKHGDGGDTLPNRFDLGWDVYDRPMPLDEIISWKVPTNHTHHVQGGR